MSGFYFYIATVSFLAGVLARSFFVVTEKELLLLLFISFGSGLLWAVRQERFALVVSLVCLFVSLGVFRFDLAASSEQLALPVDEEVVVRAEVRSDPEEREKNIHLYLREVSIAGKTYDVGVLAYVDSGYDISYGDVLELTGELQRPESFETELGRVFNYPGYLEARGVSYVLYYPEVAVVANSAGNGVFQKIFTFKDAFKRAVESVIPEPHVGLGEGLLLGEKSGLGERLEEVFRKTGIIHIVVLSGYNVMLVVVFVMTILSYVLGKRVRVLFGVAAIVAFAVMVGLSATVVRASIMAVLILIAQATGQTYAVMRALFVAALFMVVWNPYLVAFDPGFQLSFLATFGLIVLAPQLELRLQFIPAAIGTRSFLVATLATQIFVLPFLLYQIGEVSLVAVVVNILVLPMVPVAMLLTFIAGMIALLNTQLAAVFGFCAHLSLGYILAVAAWFAELPVAAVSLPPFHVGWMLSGYAILGYVLWRLYNPKEIDVLDGWTIEEEREDGVMLRITPSEGSSFFR